MIILYGSETVTHDHLYLQYDVGLMFRIGNGNNPVIETQTDGVKE